VTEKASVICITETTLSNLKKLFSDSKDKFSEVRMDMLQVEIDYFEKRLKKLKGEDEIG
jgi:hypothetical protein